MNYSFCFSPTGGTKKVAEIICKNFFSVEEADLSSPQFPQKEYSFQKEDFCVISCPVFMGRIPPTALERLEMMRAPGTPALIVAVYGNRAYEDALLELKNCVEKSGFTVIAAISAVAEHSIQRKIAAGRPDAEDEKQLEKFAVKVSEKLSEEDRTPVAVPGNFPYTVKKSSGFHPTGNAECTRCGLCAAQCPVSAIPKEDPQTVLSERCFSCMRCVTICPAGARIMPEKLLAGITQHLQPLCEVRKENELFI